MAINKNTFNVNYKSTGKISQLVKFVQKINKNNNTRMVLR